MKKVFIVSAKRTPIGRFMGSLSTIKPGQLGAIVIKSILEETGMDSSKIDSVIAGNVLSAGQAQGVARQCAIHAESRQKFPLIASIWYAVAE